MPYQVQFTDTTNPNKQPITVSDGSVNNTSTSLSFVGQNYPGYAPIIANDFLHLLENFAAPTSPSYAVQGQLWYDTGTNILKVYDGSSWSTAGSLKKSAAAPAIANSLAGDLWSNITTNQLFVFSGSSWLLVGPQFSSGSQTGPVVESIVDTGNITHSVLTTFANNNRITITSKEQFTPKVAITGFATIYEGVNLSSVDATNATSLTRYWGTAQQADALLVNGTTISSSKFVTTDGTTNTINSILNVQSDNGLRIGSALGLIIDIESAVPTIKSTNSGVGINFNLTNGSTVSTVMHVDSSGTVGIGFNNLSPTSTLDVKGTITVRNDTTNSISGKINITGTTSSSWTYGIPTTASGSLTTQGGIFAATQSIFAGGLVSYGQPLPNATPALIVNYLDSGGNPQAGSVVLPGYTTSSTESTSVSPNIPLVSAGLYDIGSPTRSFRNVYAQNFSGNFSGTFTGTLQGSISGTAAALASPTVFSMTGDVASTNSISFNGQTASGTAVFTTKINSNFVSSQTVATDSQLADSLLVYRSGVGLLQMSKSVLFNHQALMPIATILPFAGTTVPTGYLLCDGSEVLISTYSLLYSAIGYTYKAAGNLKGLGTFALPDLRGRFPLGADNMNNGNTVPSKDGSGTLITTTTDITGATNTRANRVTDTSATIVGSGNSSANGSVTLITSNLPDHNHSLNDGTSQFYAVNTPNQAPDANAATKVGTPGTGAVGNGILNTATYVGSTGTPTPVSVMNPYQTINYIIFTGNI
jgi:microcystin-dependent protein